MKYKFLLAISILLFVFKANATKYYVNKTVSAGDIYTIAAGNNANAGTPAAPFLTLGKALSVATAGDTIYVDADTYNSSSGSGITKEGGYTIAASQDGIKIIGAGITATVFDGTNYMSSTAISNFYWLNITGNNVVIQNMTLKKYFKQGAIDITASAAATDSSRTYITNVFFDNNESDNTYDGVNNQGGAVWISASTKPAAVYFTSSHFNQNLAETGAGGGAIFAKASGTVASTIILEGCRLTCNNTTGVDLATYDGGAILLNNAAAKINNSFFSGNKVNDRKGGAIYSNNTLAGYLPLTITNTIFASNRGRQGVAVFADGKSTCTITNSLFYSNLTTSGFGNGGTISCDGTTNMNIVNSTIANNTSSGSDGSGLAIEAASSYNVLNSIIYGNQVGNVSSAAISATYCDIENVGDLHSGVTGNINANPLFTNATNFTLQGTSPAINTGTTTGAPARDLTNTIRSGNPDMGCFESGSTFPTVSTTCGLFLTCATPSITSVAASPNVCSGSTFTSALVSSPAGATFNWISLDVSGISGHSNSGIGNINETLTNSGSTSLNVTYTITPTLGSCVGSSTIYTVTVVPAPTMSSASSKTICSSNSVNLALTSAIASSYSWLAASNANTGGESTSAQTGATINDVLTNTTTATEIVSYTVTPTSTAGNCVGTAQTVNITVTPAPTMTSTSTKSICSGSAVALALTSSIASSYSWIGSDNTNTGGESTSAQTSSTINDVLTNTTTASEIVTYTVTPTSTSGSCVGSTQTISVTVNPTPSIASSITQSICSGTTLNLNLTSNVPSNFTWTASDNSNTNGESTSAQNTSLINDNISHSQATSQDVFYTITPTATIGTCLGTAQTLTVTVNPTPLIGALSNPASNCAGQTVNAFTFTTSPAGATVNWTNNNINTGLAANGVGSPINGFTANNVNSQEISIISLTPTLGTCNGATTSYTLTINPNPTLVIGALDVLNPSACGNNDGHILGLTVNGSPTIQYSWNNGAYTSLDLNNLLAGTYNLLATDGNGCTVDTSLTLSDPSSPSAPAFTITTDTVCDGGSTTLSITNPDINTTYNWVGPLGPIGTGTTITISPASEINEGLYNASATLAGCTGSLSLSPVSLIVNENPVVQLTPNANTFCEDANLVLTANVTNPGGTATIPSNGYQWILNSNPISGANASTYTTNQAGTYELIVTNSNNCSSTNASLAVTINSEPSISLSGVLVDSADCSGANGSISNITINNGTSDYTFNWFNSSNNLLSSTISSTNAVAPLTNIGAGAYTLIVIDSKGCNDTVSVSINNFDAPATPSIASNPSNCSGTTLNPISVTGTGGTFNWYGDIALTNLVGNGNPFTPSITSTDTLYVTQSLHNCESNGTEVIVIINPTPNAPTALGATYCQGETIQDLTASDGTGTINWYSDNTLATLIGTGSPFNSGIIATDTVYVNETALNCTGALTEVIISVNALPSLPIVTANGPLTFCDGNTVTLTANPSNGIVWSPSGSTNGSITVTTNGSFAVTYTDNNNCSSTSANTDVVVNTNPTAPTLNLGSGSSSLCSGDSATISAAPTTGLTWSNGSNNSSIVVTTSGNYSAFITDINNCISPNATINIIVNNNPTIGTSFAIDTAYCNLASGGINNISVSGGTSPYSYIWLSNNNTISTDSVLNNALSGSYTYIVVDQNGCSDTSTNINVPLGNGIDINLVSDIYQGYEPSDANLTSNVVTGNPINYSWFLNNNLLTGQNSSTLNLPSLTAGIYTTSIVANDLNGCYDTATVTIIIESQIKIIIPNVFTPNGDGANDAFIITVEGLKEIEIVIYDRWGLLMYSQKAEILSWDGKLKNGELASDGTYYFLFSGKDLKNNLIEKQGYVTLIK